jgi:hypothetical protein
MISALFLSTSIKAGRSIVSLGHQEPCRLGLTGYPVLLRQGIYLRYTLRKIGLVGLVFFTVKGLIWLLAGAVMVALAID